MLPIAVYRQNTPTHYPDTANESAIESIGANTRDLHRFLKSAMNVSACVEWADCTHLPWRNEAFVHRGFL